MRWVGRGRSEPVDKVGVAHEEGRPTSLCEGVAGLHRAVETDAVCLEPTEIDGGGIAGHMVAVEVEHQIVGRRGRCSILRVKKCRFGRGHSVQMLVGNLNVCGGRAVRRLAGDPKAQSTPSEYRCEKYPDATDDDLTIHRCPAATPVADYCLCWSPLNCSMTCRNAEICPHSQFSKRRRLAARLCVNSPKADESALPPPLLPAAVA